MIFSMRWFSGAVTDGEMTLSIFTLNIMWQNVNLMALGVMILIVFILNIMWQNVK